VAARHQQSAAAKWQHGVSISAARGGRALIKRNVTGVNEKHQVSVSRKLRRVYRSGADAKSGINASAHGGVAAKQIIMATCENIMAWGHA